MVFGRFLGGLVDDFISLIGACLPQKNLWLLIAMLDQGVVDGGCQTR